jgi:(S)-2-hydroxyglutarate dehydrogenase
VVRRGCRAIASIVMTLQIGPTAIPALWREQYGLLDRFNLGELIENVMIESGLFLDAGFNFRELAFEEMRKYWRPFMIRGASELVKNVDSSSFGSYGRPGIRAQLLDLKTRSLVMDFRVEGDASSTHVLNAVSPAWTCSVPFAKHVCDTMILS